MLKENFKRILKFIPLPIFIYCLSFNLQISSSQPPENLSSSPSDNHRCFLKSTLVDVGGYKLNFNVIAGNGPAILFESGGGNDSSVWQEVYKRICQKHENEIITYDRAGFGKSEPNPSQSPYDITEEVKALESGLKVLNINKKIIIVAHSYGGFLALLFAARNPEQIAGIVLIDANLSDFFTNTRVNTMMKEIAENKELLQRDKPSLFRALEAFPSTVETMKKVKLPISIPIIDIVAETPPFTSEEDNAAWKLNHEKFAKMFNNRRMVLAAHSGHYIMVDNEDLIVNEISKIISYYQTTDP